MLLRHNGDCEECNNFVSFQIIKRNENLNEHMPAMIKQKNNDGNDHNIIST